MLAFSKNGQMLPNCSIARVRPANNVYPAVSVHDGGVCFVSFLDDDFKFTPASKKFKMIVGASSLI